MWLWILGGLVVVFTYLMVFSLCKVASKCEREIGQ